MRVAGDFHSFWSGVIAPVACSGKACVSVGVVEPLSSDPMQSPAHSLVPRTVPTSLQPIGSFGFTWTRGLLPSFGGALWANAVVEKQIATRMNNDLIVNLPFASRPPDRAGFLIDCLLNQPIPVVWKLAPGESESESKLRSLERNKGDVAPRTRWHVRADRHGTVTNFTPGGP